MVPIVSCVWSCAPRTALLYPARSLFTFLDHHGALSVSGSPSWRTVVGGSRSYVERAAKELTATELSTPVRSVGAHRDRHRDPRRRRRPPHVRRRSSSPPTPTTRSGCWSTPTAAERATLGAFSSSVNETVLHTDGRVLPRHPRAARVVELPPRPLRVDRRRGARQLRHEPAAPARRVARPRRHPQPRCPGRRRAGAGAHALHASRCTPRRRSPRRRHCRA